VSVESDTHPDFHLRLAYPPEDIETAVECKFKTLKPHQKRVYWTYEAQLARYVSFQHEKGINVYLFIAVNGSGCSPKELFIAPMDVLIQQSQVDENSEQAPIYMMKSHINAYLVNKNDVIAKLYHWQIKSLHAKNLQPKLSSTNTVKKLDTINH
jgi:hypothetical protein